MKVLNFFSLLIALSVFGLSFSSCGDDKDDDKGGLMGSPKTYKVEVTFEGKSDGYFKQVAFSAVNENALPVNVINADTNKELSGTHLSDDNYTFSASNSFTFTDKLAYLIVVISASSDIDNKEELQVTLTVYENGKEIKKIVETATNKKSISINQTFGGK